jgi:hypothetical protein
MKLKIQFMKLGVFCYVYFQGFVWYQYIGKQKDLYRLQGKCSGNSKLETKDQYKLQEKCSGNSKLETKDQYRQGKCSGNSKQENKGSVSTTRKVFW